MIVDPIQELSFLEKLGLGLSGIDNVNQYRQQGINSQLQSARLQQMQLENERELANRSALQELAGRIQQGDLSRDDALLEYSRLTGDFSPFLRAPNSTPAAIQIFDRVQNMTPEERDLFFRTQRGQQTINLGDRQVVLDPQGGVRESYLNELAPADLPETRYQQTGAAEQAKVDVARRTNVGKLEDQANLMLNN